MMICYENDAEAPVDSCRCLSCCYARRSFIPSEIAALCDIKMNEKLVINYSSAIVSHAINMYISGLTTLEEMKIAIIRTLAEYCDKLSEELMKAYSIQNNPIYVPETAL